MKPLQRFICRTIERSCYWIGLGHRWYSCHYVANLAFRLDERWQCNTWRRQP